MNENDDTRRPPVLRDEDTSDPCAELDFNDMTNENSASVEDDRFALPSETLHQG